MLLKIENDSMLSLKSKLLGGFKQEEKGKTNIMVQLLSSFLGKDQQRNHLFMFFLGTYLLFIVFLSCLSLFVGSHIPFFPLQSPMVSSVFQLLCALLFKYSFNVQDILDKKKKDELLSMLHVRGEIQ